MSAALELFVERGYAATRLEDVAARAGVSKGTVYLYFSGKEALFQAVIREGLLPALEQGERLAAGHGGSAAQLLADLLRGWWQLVGAQKVGGLPKLMIAEARNFPQIARFYHDEVIVRGHRLLGQALELGMARGEFRRCELEPTLSILFAPVLMLAVWRHSFVPCGCTDGPPEAYLESCIDFILRALAPESARGGETPT